MCSSDLAVVENGKIKVWSDKVKEPETVRYGWQPFTRANLVRRGLFPGGVSSLTLLSISILNRLKTGFPL